MRHVTIASNLHQILLGQQFQCNNLHTYFPTHMTQFRTLLMGLSPFLASLSGIYSQREMRGVYTYAIGLPRQAVVEMVEDGSPALCGQTATVTTVL